eukprot:GHVP01053954.1.p1 GENE.GHVP01053954.1~~GHVP01053954.1.p1  ORF type:complete len:284 (+),score=4.79 GHVP01053954.1:409-1260(+)
MDSDQRDVVFICVRNCYVGAVKGRTNESTYHGGFVVNYGNVNLENQRKGAKTCHVHHHTGQLSANNPISKYVTTLSQLLTYTGENTNDSIQTLWYIGHMADTRLVLHGYTSVDLVDHESLCPLTGVEWCAAHNGTMMSYIFSKRCISEDMVIRLSSPPSGTGRLALASIITNQIVSRRLYAFANVRAIKEITANLGVVSLFSNVVAQYGLLWHTGCAYLFSSSSLPKFRRQALDSLHFEYTKEDDETGTTQTVSLYSGPNLQRQQQTHKRVAHSPPNSRYPPG